MIDPSASHQIVSRWKLGLADQWYSIQSETLHIPDRFGFFTPGSPPSRVFEVEGFIRLLTLQLAFVPFYTICFSRLPEIGIFQALKDSGPILVSQFMLFVIIWAMYCCLPRPSSVDWETWEYGDDNTGDINYWKEIFECHWRGWDKFLLSLVCIWLNHCADFSWVGLKVVAIVDEAMKMLCGRW